MARADFMNRTAASASPARSSSDDVVHEPVDAPDPLLSKRRLAMPSVANSSAYGRAPARVAGPDPCRKTTPGDGPAAAGSISVPRSSTEPFLKLTSRSVNGGVCAVASPLPAAIRSRAAKQPRRCFSRWTQLTSVGSRPHDQADDVAMPPWFPPPGAWTDRK